MSASERRAAIKASRKPDCLVTGFYSNLADLKLWVNAEDIIGAGLPEKVRRRAAKIKDGDTTTRLLKAKEQVEAEDSFHAWEQEHRRNLEAERLKLFTPRAMVRKTTVDVYGESRPVYGDHESQERETYLFRTSKSVSADRRPSVKAARFAVALGLSPDHCMGMTGKQVGGWISHAKESGAQPVWSRCNAIKYGLSWFFSDAGRDQRDSQEAAS
jgi:hypothetical protein